MNAKPNGTINVVLGGDNQDVCCKLDVLQLRVDTTTFCTLFQYKLHAHKNIYKLNQ